MSQRIGIGLGLVVFLTLNAVVLMRALRRDAPEAADLEKTRAEEMRKIRAGRRAIPVFISNEPLGLIGALVEFPRWSKVLPLAKEQADVITKLDHLLREARVSIWIDDAEHPADDLGSYRKHLTRSDARLSAAIRHSQRIVSLGLLTQPQSLFVIQKYLLDQRPMQILSDKNVQELIGITGEQKERLAKVGENAISKNSPADFVSKAMSPDSKVREQAGVEMIAISKAADATAKEILTPEQREKWNQLTVKQTLPAEPPDLPVPTEAETAQIKLEKMSPIFHTLAEKAEAIGLSGEQKRLLKDLKDVTRLGLFWISHRDGKAPFPPGIDGSGQADPVTRTRDEFLKHAGQVALLGILTQQQAEEIEKAVKQN